MGLHTYAARSSEFAQEIAAGLTRTEIVSLAAELKAMGWRAWLRWQDEFERDIDGYVCATPAARAKKARWNDPAIRSKLALAAITHCLAAHAVQGFFADHATTLSPGGPYRDTTALAGSIYWKFWDIDVPDWPVMFERVCPSPFPQRS